MHPFLHRGEMILHSACIFELVAYFLALRGGCVDYVVGFGVDVFLRAAFLLVGARCNLLLHFDNHLYKIVTVFGDFDV